MTPTSTACIANQLCRHIFKRGTKLHTVSANNYTLNPLWTQPYSDSFLTFRPWYLEPDLADIHSSVEYRLVVQEIYHVLVIYNAPHNAWDPMAKFIHRLNAIPHMKRHFRRFKHGSSFAHCNKKQRWWPLHKNTQLPLAENSSPLTLPPCIDHAIYLQCNKMLQIKYILLK